MSRFLLTIAFALAGCGYVGDPLPPALNIPAAVADLRVVQRADKLVFDYTAPALTTEALGLTSITSAEADISGQSIQLDIPKPGETAHSEVPARDWVKQDISVTVILGGPKGRKSPASNPIALRVVEPLRPPEGVKAEAHPEGVRVSWQGSTAKYRVAREPEATAVVEAAEYIDRNAEMGKEYRYTVVALGEGVESLASAPATVVPRDTFAPKPPAGVTAIAGVNSIELAWERGAEADIRSYRVYRDGQSIGDTEVPSFSDKQLTSARRYRYELTAIDQSGNEGGKSQAVDIAAP